MIILWAGCAGFVGANVVSRWFGQSDGAAISIVSSENFGQLEGDGKCFFIREGTSGLEPSRLLPAEYKSRTASSLLERRLFASDELCGLPGLKVVRFINALMLLMLARLSVSLG